MTNPSILSVSSRLVLRFLLALAVATVLALLWGDAAHASGPAVAAATGTFHRSHPPAPCENDVWMISTRGARREKHPRLRYWQSRGGRWVRSNLKEFLAADVPGMPTCFWVHGWRITHDEARKSGYSVYQRLRCYASEPIRFVIWSWPSTQTLGFIEDARQKAYLSDVGAYPLAWLIDQIQPDVPVGLVGFSLGARLSTGALHLLGGGRLLGWKLSHRVHPSRTRMRAALLAGALDNFSLAKGQRNGRALAQVDRMVSTVNSNDLVLKWYPLLQGWHGPEAIGYTGPTRDVSPDYSKLEIMCVGHMVGRRHHWDPYIDSPPIASAIVDAAMFGDRVQDERPRPRPFADKKHQRRWILRIVR